MGCLEARARAWEIGLRARSTPPGGGPFALVAALQTELRLSAAAEPGRDARSAGDAARIEVRMRPRLSWSLGRQAREAVPLFDDGQHGDGAAGDSVFAATWTPEISGEITVHQVMATGTNAAGNPFERLSVLGVSVE